MPSPRPSLKELKLKQEKIKNKLDLILKNQEAFDLAILQEIDKIEVDSEPDRLWKLALIEDVFK